MPVDNANFHALHADIRVNGWTTVSKANQFVFDTITGQLASTLYDSDIRLDNSKTHNVAKPQAIPYHCDSPRAFYIAWICVDAGQRSVPLDIVDTLVTLDLLPQHTIEILKSIRLGFNCRVSNRLCSMPILSVSANQKTTVFFNPWNIPKNLTDEQYDAIEQFQQAIDKSPSKQVAFETGDILMIDNHRMVHGRQSLDQGSTRHLIRRLMYVPGDTLPIREVRTPTVKTH
ncbi:TauD/TfdA family dioxygenase [Rhizobium sp. 2YAF20]|uniref:TauD/TfdA family dioxygenase n=1 Tax=Rhizobium sp. 2YAF20 TaxID=3233027 RepID=UPI003F97AF21